MTIDLAFMQYVPEVIQKSLALQTDMQINVAIEPWHWWSERNRIRGREKRRTSLNECPDIGVHEVKQQWSQIIKALDNKVGKNRGRCTKDKH